MNLTQRQLIEIIHEKVIRLEVTLLGNPGTDDAGLVGEIKDIKTNVKNLNTRHRKLSKVVWLLIGVLIGSGILAGGIYNLISG